jgi:hypothetical protein
MSPLTPTIPIKIFRVYLSSSSSMTVEYLKMDHAHFVACPFQVYTISPELLINVIKNIKRMLNK